MYQDRLVYVLEEAVAKKMPKLAGKLTKLADGDAKVEDGLENLLGFFHMDPALARASKERRKEANLELKKLGKIDFNELLRQECMSFSTLSFI